jgi:hypothetical protein
MRRGRIGLIAAIVIIAAIALVVWSMTICCA